MCRDPRQEIKVRNSELQGRMCDRGACVLEASRFFASVWHYLTVTQAPRTQVLGNTSCDTYSSRFARVPIMKKQDAAGTP
jgi:hypothetical protein